MIDKKSSTARTNTRKEPMKMPFSTAVAAMVLAIAGAASAAPTITYTVVDLANTTPSQDLQRYQYKLTGPIDAFGGVTLFFNSGLYGTLSNLSTSEDPAVLATTPLFAANEATVTSPSGIAASSVLFSIDFVWLGGLRAPGAQPFDAFDGEGGAVFTTSQFTTPAGGPTAVPEPGSLALSAAALLAAITTRRRAARQR